MSLYCQDCGGVVLSASAQHVCNGQIVVTYSPIDPNVVTTNCACDGDDKPTDDAFADRIADRAERLVERFIEGVERLERLERLERRREKNDKRLELHRRIDDSAEHDLCGDPVAAERLDRTQAQFEKILDENDAEIKARRAAESIDRAQIESDTR